MAKQYGGYLGGFSGKLGPAIGYMWNGRWCLRSRPQVVHNPRTAAQEAHRSAFRSQVQLAARMRWAVCQGFTALAREHGMTAYNLFMHLNQSCFSMTDGALQVDWEGLQLSMGPVAPVALREATVEADNVLNVSFEQNPLRLSAKSYDRVSLYLYAPATGQGYMTAPVYRRTQHLSLALPAGMAGHEVHLYLMVQDDAGRRSASAYGGCLTLTAGATTAVPTADTATQPHRPAMAEQGILTLFDIQDFTSSPQGPPSGGGTARDAAVAARGDGR